MKGWLIAAMGMGSTLLSGEEEAVRLQYLPNVPVWQTSQLHIERYDAFPGFKMDEKASQVIESVVTIMGDHAEWPLGQLPIDLNYVLKKIQVQLTANNVAIDYNSLDSHATLPFAQASALINQPIKVRIDPSFNLKKENPALSKLLEELPALKHLKLDLFFLEWFHPLFALAGKDLVVGNSYKVHLEESDHPYSFQYTIHSISDEAIDAAILGMIEMEGIKLKGQFSFDGIKNSDAELFIVAKVQGHVTWNRKNALQCRLDTHTSYTGILKIGDSTWNLGMNLDHHLNSK